MKLSISKDLLSGTALLAIAIAYYAASFSILDAGLIDDSGVGARGLPTVLAVLLALVALGIMARGVLRRGASSPADPEKEREAPPPRALGLLLIGILYIPAASFLGYLPALFMVLCAVALYEGARFGWRVFTVAAGGTLFFWLLFVIFLGVAQPQASLFP
jgi:hypothetical protein